MYGEKFENSMEQTGTVEIIEGSIDMEMVALSRLKKKEVPIVSITEVLTVRLRLITTWRREQGAHPPIEVGDARSITSEMATKKLGPRSGDKSRGPEGGGRNNSFFNPAGPPSSEGQSNKRGGGK